METHHEVLLYLRKVRKYFQNTKEEDRQYFFDEENVESFFKRVEEIAVKNFNEKGLPELTKEQFESLNSNSNKLVIGRGENWIEYSKIGKIYLN